MCRLAVDLNKRVQLDSKLINGAYLVWTREVERVSTPKMRSGDVFPSGISIIFACSARPARFLTMKSIYLRNFLFDVIMMNKPVIVRWCWLVFLIFFVRFSLGGTLTWPCLAGRFFSIRLLLLLLDAGAAAGCALALLAMRTERYMGGTDLELERRLRNTFKY